MKRLLPQALATRLALALALAATGTASALAVAAHAQGGDTSAVAVNTHDGSSIFRLTFQIRRVMGDTVDNQNAAVAYSSCQACQTVAISIQVLLIGSDPSTFTPQNTAIAINQNCVLCDTLASAYQFAVGIGTQLKFTAEGNQQIAAIRRQLEQLRNSGLSGADLQSRVDGLMNQLSQVLSTQLVGVAQPAADTGQSPPQPSTSQPSSSGGGSGTDTSGTDTTGTESQPTGGSPTSTTPDSAQPPQAQTTPPGGTTTTPSDGGDTNTTPTTSTTP